MSLHGLPLFVLGPDFFPGFTGTLRVFEPRYKQMMDDCIMDSKPFGYISADPNKGELNGWSQPSDHGVLCYVKDYEESGSNLIIEVEATTAFAVKDVIHHLLVPRLEDAQGAGEPREEVRAQNEEWQPVQAHVGSSWWARLMLCIRLWLRSVSKLGREIALEAGTGHRNPSRRWTGQACSHRPASRSRAAWIPGSGRSPRPSVR